MTHIFKVTEGRSYSNQLKEYINGYALDMLRLNGVCDALWWS